MITRIKKRKEGCSLNGSNEFLKETGFLRYHSIHSVIFDSRGVVVTFQGDCDICHHSQEFDETILKFKQFVGIVRSTISIVEEEREAMNYVLSIVDQFLARITVYEFQSLVQDPTKFFRNNQPTVSTCFGHVIRFGPYTQPIMFDPTTNVDVKLSSFEQLSHLRSLRCIINDFHEDNTQVLDEFGSGFGPKLSHLSISFNDKFSSNQIEDCFSKFTRLKYLVLHHVSKFHPSFH